MDAYLTVNSLALLGFNTDNYPFLYEGLAYTIKPLTIHTFHSENETILLCALHFLLIRLDSVKFSEEIKNCWPFLDIKGKNNYKHAIHSCLERVSVRYKQSCNLTTVYWSLHYCAKAEEIWALLRSLSDLCLNFAIVELLSDKHKDVSNNISNNSNEEVCNNEDENESWILADVAVSSPKEESILSIHDPILHIRSSKEELMDTMIQLQNDIKDEILMKIAKQYRQRIYMEELNVRYKKAKALLDTNTATTTTTTTNQKKSMSTIRPNQKHLNNRSTTNPPLINSAEVITHTIISQQQNTRRINKLKDSLLLLKELVNSILLETGITNLSMEKEQHLYHYSNQLNEMQEFFKQEITILSNPNHQNTLQPNPNLVTLINDSSVSNDNNNYNNIFNNNYATKYQAGEIELQAAHCTISDDMSQLIKTLELLATKLKYN